MKSLKLLTLPIIISIVLLSCTTKNVPNYQSSRVWKLVELDGYVKEKLIKKDVTLDLSENHNIASTNCQSIKIKVKWLPNNRVTIKNVEDLSSSCQRTKMEDDYFEKLFSSQYYQIEGHFLTLRAKDGKFIKFVAADWD